MANPMAGNPPGSAPVAGPAAGRSWPAKPLALRLAAFVLIAACCALGAWLGVWFVPFIGGVAAGALAARRLRWVVWPAAGGAVLGWAIPLWAMALSDLPSGATARAIAALAGLPPSAAVAITVTLLLAVLQTLVGAWLARAVLPRRRAAG